jgi:hypothetical protein
MNARLSREPPMRRFGSVVRGSGQRNLALEKLAGPFLAVLALSGAIILGPSIPAAQQKQKVDVTGPYKHAPSGMTFPVAIGAFQRQVVLREGEDRNNEAGEYTAIVSGARIMANVHVFPSGELMNINLTTGKRLPADDKIRGMQNHYCQKVFAVAFQALSNLSPSGAQVLQEPTSFIHSGRPYAGLKAYVVLSSPSAYGKSHPPLRSESHLFCFVGGRWYVRYGFTYPAFLDARAQIESFIGQTMTIPAEQ